LPTGFPAFFGFRACTGVDGAFSGSTPYRTPLPTASHGSTSSQPAFTRLGSLSRPLSGCLRPVFRLKISVERASSPRNRLAISVRFSGSPW
jgi:hypothetical protein